MPVRWRLTLFNALVIGAILLVLGLGQFFLLLKALFSGIEDTARAHPPRSPWRWRPGKSWTPATPRSLPWTGSSSSCGTGAGAS